MAAELYAALSAAQRRHAALREVGVRYAAGHCALGSHVIAGCALSHIARNVTCDSMDCSIYEARVTALAKVKCLTWLIASFERALAARGGAAPRW